jgi:hypothetical protein
MDGPRGRHALFFFVDPAVAVAASYMEPITAWQLALDGILYIALLVAGLLLLDNCVGQIFFLCRCLERHERSPYGTLHFF